MSRSKRLQGGLQFKNLHFVELLGIQSAMKLQQTISDFKIDTKANDRFEIETGNKNDGMVNWFATEEGQNKRG